MDARERGGSPYAERCCLVGLVAALSGAPAMGDIHAIHIEIGRFVVAAITGFAAAVFAYGLAMTLRRKRRQAIA